MSDKKEKDSNWMQNLWRPMMGWMYMVICFADMIVFPVLWSLLQAMMHQPITQWNPLTLQGAGLFHIAMGAVLGIAAFGRTQEKLAGTAVNPMSNTQTVNMNGNVAGGFGSNTMNNSFNPSNTFGSQPQSFNQPTSFGGTPNLNTQPAALSVGFGGKKAPPAAYQPEI